MALDVAAEGDGPLASKAGHHDAAVAASENRIVL